MFHNRMMIAHKNKEKDYSDSDEGKKKRKELMKE